MARNTDAKRADLKTKLVDIAEQKIGEEGIASLKARPLAAEAGCAVGAIYNVFGDLNDLVLAVNMRTFKALGEEVGEAVAPDESPADALITLGHAYLHFAMNRPRHWRALFDVELTAESDVPDWYSAELARLMGYIAAQVKALKPELSDADVMLVTRTLFSSIHGIVWLGLENRVSGVPQSELERMIEIILRAFSK
ncbi:MAG: TetR/AcrR family transcriptional regulator [Planktomarina sp.]